MSSFKFSKKFTDQLKKAVDTVPNFPKKGIMFRDITSLLMNHRIFKKTILEISNQIKKGRINKIVAIESRGFIFASVIAFKCNLPLVLIRKKNKLPQEAYKVKYSLEYGSDELELQKRDISNNDKLLVIDDLIATGGTALAAAKLAKKVTKNEITFLFIVELEDLPGMKKLINAGHVAFSICKFNETEK